MVDRPLAPFTNYFREYSLLVELYVAALLRGARSALMDEPLTQPRAGLASSKHLYKFSPNGVYVTPSPKDNSSTLRDRVRQSNARALEP